MKRIGDLDFGFADAENYKKRENKDLFNRVFIKNDYLDSLCDLSVSFLMGEKGTGKTAYAIYMVNSTYKNNRSDIKYIRETEYRKFITLKEDKHLQLPTSTVYFVKWLIILRTSLPVGTTIAWDSTCFGRNYLSSYGVLEWVSPITL